jgi:hypothetical protein
MVRTDVIINWTIQRSFPWAWVVLFVEQIDVPVSIFLSEKDALVPADRVEAYLRTKDVPVEPKAIFGTRSTVPYFAATTTAIGQNGHP